jgi:hypothetical protein
MLAAPPQGGEPTKAGKDRALDFFNEVNEAFEAAAQARVLDHFYRLGGYAVRLRFAGEALMSTMSSALAHLTTGPEPRPDLTVCLWDSASTGCRMPRAPWREHYAMRGEIEGYNTARMYAIYEHESRGITMFDNERGLGLFWVPEAGSIPYWVKGSPLRTILHWWMGQHGRQMVHAAAVGTSTEGVLITGKSGSGKSTTALACLDAGLQYAGDDYVLVGLEPSLFVFSLYNTAKIVADHLHAFPRLADLIDNRDRLSTEKALVFLDGCYAEQLSPGFPLRAIVVPRVTGRRETRLKKASPAAALAALAPTTIFAQPRGGDKDFRNVASLVKKVPAYLLECGTDLAEIPAAIAGLLSGAHT